MGDLSQSRIGTVRRLLEYAPDTAVHSLESLMASDGSIDLSASAIRELVMAERSRRRLRDTVFSPLAGLFNPQVSLQAGLGPPQLPADLPGVLWRALKDDCAEQVERAAKAFAAAPRSPACVAAMDALCQAAADGLSSRRPAFEPALERLERQSCDLKRGDLARGDLAHSDLARLIARLTLAPVLRQALDTLPAWLSCHTGEHDPAMRSLWARAEREGGGVMFVETIFAHLEHPPQILRLISLITDRPTDRLFAICEYAGFGERLIEQIDAQIEIVRRFDPQRGLEGGVAVASASASAHQTMSAFEQHIVLAKEGVWGGRIAAQRRALALAMEMRLREAEPAVAATLPTTPIRVAGKRMRGPAELSRPPEQRAVDRAIALLALVEGSRASAAMAGFGALRLKVLETLDALLESYANDLLERLHKGASNAARIREYLDVAGEFMALVRGPEAGEFLRRRAAAA